MQLQQEPVIGPFHPPEGGLLPPRFIVLGAVLHHPPTVQPNAGLLWSMRVFLLMYMIYSWAKVVQSLVHLHEHEIKQHG